MNDTATAAAPLRLVRHDEAPGANGTPPAAEAAPPLMTPDELAAALQISTRTVRRLELLGKIGPRPIGLGRAVRYPRPEVAAWIAARCPDRDTWTATQPRKK